MPLPPRSRIIPLSTGAVLATGVGMIPLHRLPRTVRWGYVLVPAVLAAGALIIGPQRLRDDPAPSSRDEAPSSQDEPASALPSGLRRPTTRETALAVGVGALLAGISAGGIQLDRAVDGLLRRRGVPAPRVWMGVASGALWCALTALDGPVEGDPDDDEQFAQLADEVLALLSDADPMGLAPGGQGGCPEDEYLAEACAISGILLTQGEITAAALDAEWERWFEEPLTPRLGPTRSADLLAALSSLTPGPSAR